MIRSFNNTSTTPFDGLPLPLIDPQARVKSEESSSNVLPKDVFHTVTAPAVAMQRTMWDKVSVEKEASSGGDVYHYKLNERYNLSVSDKASVERIRLNEILYPGIEADVGDFAEPLRAFGWKVVSVTVDRAGVMATEMHLPSVQTMDYLYQKQIGLCQSTKIQSADCSQYGFTFEELERYVQGADKIDNVSSLIRQLQNVFDAEKASYERARQSLKKVKYAFRNTEDSTMTIAGHKKVKGEWSVVVQYISSSYNDTCAEKAELLKDIGAIQIVDQKKYKDLKAYLQEAFQARGLVRLETILSHLKNHFVGYGLPLLHFVASEGIIDDEKFINCFLNDEMPVSIDEEFIHDMTVHVARILCNHLSSEDREEQAHLFSEMKEKVRDIKQKIVESKLNETEKMLLMMVLSAHVDNFTSLTSEKQRELIAMDFADSSQELNREPLWGKYITKRLEQLVERVEEGKHEVLQERKALLKAWHSSNTILSDLWMKGSTAA
jgi:hypothetical protein